MHQLHTPDLLVTWHSKVNCLNKKLQKFKVFSNTFDVTVYRA